MIMRKECVVYDFFYQIYKNYFPIESRKRERGDRENGQLPVRESRNSSIRLAVYALSRRGEADKPRSRLDSRREGEACKTFA